MKTVFTSSELAHVWANRGAPYGRNAGGSMSFTNDALRSYQTVIANRVMNGKGAVAYVIDYATFSQTTHKHQSAARRAIPSSAKTFGVRIGARNQVLSFSPATLRDHYIAESKAITAELPSRYAFKRAEQFERASAKLRSAVEVCEFFGLGHTVLDREISARAALFETGGAAEMLREKRKAMIKRDAAKVAREQAERAELMAEAVRLFRAGHSVGHSYSLMHEVPTMLRREHFAGTNIPAHDEMVTSRGARVPLADAERAYKFACLKRAHGWHRNGEQFKCGMYQLDAVNEFGVIAGCHRVAWEEVDRFAESQGWVSKGGAL